MESQVRTCRLACVASLTVLLASCGSHDKQLHASDAASAGSATTSASSEAATGSSEPVSPTQPPSRQPQPRPPAPNPNPPPGTVSYDLPNDGSDLGDEDNWRAGFADKCRTAGHPRDCLHMSVVVSAVGPDGKEKAIADPGPNYADNGVYSDCHITHIKPEPPVTVPVGTTVVIKVLCTPVAGGTS